MYYVSNVRARILQASSPRATILLRASRAGVADTSNITTSVVASIIHLQPKFACEVRIVALSITIHRSPHPPGQISHETRSTKHEARSTKHKAQSTKHKAQNTKQKTQSTKHKGRRLSKWTPVSRRCARSYRNYDSDVYTLSRARLDHDRRHVGNGGRACDAAVHVLRLRRRPPAAPGLSRAAGPLAEAPLPDPSRGGGVPPPRAAVAVAAVARARQPDAGGRRRGHGGVDGDAAERAGRRAFVRRVGNCRLRPGRGQLPAGPPRASR